MGCGGCARIRRASAASALLSRRAVSTRRWAARSSQSAPCSVCAIGPATRAICVRQRGPRRALGPPLSRPGRYATPRRRGARCLAAKASDPTRPCPRVRSRRPSFSCAPGSRSWHTATGRPEPEPTADYSAVIVLLTPVPPHLAPQARWYMSNALLCQRMDSKNSSMK